MCETSVCAIFGPFELTVCRVGSSLPKTPKISLADFSAYTPPYSKSTALEMYDVRNTTRVVRYV
jgi:hypothetical protein